VVGLVSTDGAVAQNAALLFLPDGTVYRYFKTHLPFLGVDRFVVPGWDLPVFETEIGRIGVLICYDLRVPEAFRVLALEEADIVCLPTNWPVGAEVSATHQVIGRAAENRVYLAACNRVGTENGVSFIGLSGIYNVVGGVMAKAGAGAEVITADCDFEEAREKRTVIVPGEYELDVMGSRRPALYQRLVER
jgi:predicted amidohydrolase